MEERQRQHKFYENTMKICIIGSSNAGKSSLFTKFYDGSFESLGLPTNIADFKIRYISCWDSFFILQAWDLADNNQTFSYYKQTHGFLIVFSLTDRNSFLDVRKFINNIGSFSTKKCFIVLIGSKCDLLDDREVAYEEGKQLADQYGLMYLEVSSKNGFNVNLAFELLYTQILES